MNTFSERPLPCPSLWSKPFWDAARQRRLVIQVCGDCQAKIMYPKKFCPACLGENLGWVDSKGRGEVYTHTVQVRAAPTAFADEVPYVLAVIRLDEGVQLLSNIVGDRAASVSCGDRVLVDFKPIQGSDIVLPVFRLDPAHSRSSA